MTPEHVQTVTSIATLLTAVAALLTILEMRRQRTEGYRPVIVVDDQMVTLYRAVGGGSTRRAILLQPSGKAPVDASFSSEIRFSARNVGAGAALEVQARWEFDAMAFAAIIAKCDPEIGRGISVERDFVRYEAPGNQAMWMSRRVQEHRLGTLSPAVDKHAVLPFPFAYSFLASAYFEALFLQGLDTSFQWELPTLTLVVSLKDRAGSSHSANYRVSLELFSLSTTDKPVADGYDWSHAGDAILTVRTL
jgi:hypothetical protein